MHVFYTARLGLCLENHSEANGYDPRKTTGTGLTLGWVRGERGCG